MAYNVNVPLATNQITSDLTAINGNWEYLGQIASGTIMLFGQNSAPTGWTRKADWQDGAMFTYSAAGDLASGGSASSFATHTHTGPSHSHNMGHAVVTQNQQVINTVGMMIADTGGVSSYGAGGALDAYQLQGVSEAGGTGNSGANTAPYYQEVIVATKD